MALLLVLSVGVRCSVQKLLPQAIVLEDVVTLFHVAYNRRMILIAVSITRIILAPQQMHGVHIVWFVTREADQPIDMFSAQHIIYPNVRVETPVVQVNTRFRCLYV